MNSSIAATLTLKALAVEKKFYEHVRAAFELIHTRDAHTLTLRRKSAQTETPEPAAPPEPATAKTE